MSQSPQEKLEQARQLICEAQIANGMNDYDAVRVRINRADGLMFEAMCDLERGEKYEK